ncbi:MAG: phosphopantetheine-binding protein [Crocinitomicaceae bacterium]
MNRVEIITTTKRFLSEEFEVEETEIEDANNLQKTLDLDSLDYVDLVVVIEENLGFKPTSDDFKGIKTFSDFFDLAEKKFAEKS